MKLHKLFDELDLTLKKAQSTLSKGIKAKSQQVIFEKNQENKIKNSFVNKNQSKIDPRENILNYLNQSKYYWIKNDEKNIDIANKKKINDCTLRNIKIQMKDLYSDPKGNKNTINDENDKLFKFRRSREERILAKICKRTNAL